MIKQLLLIGLGGGLGSILRYLTSVLTAKYYSNTFPLATFFANLSGCFFIGVLIGLLEQNTQINQNLKLLLITGFMGGYTTFSTFAFENFFLLQTHNYLMTILYLGASVFGGILAVWLGLSLVK